MNNRTGAVVIFCVAVFTAGTFAVGQQTKTEPDAQPRPDQTRPQPEAVPEHVVYRMLLHHVHLFNQKAEEAEREGRNDSAHAYRTAFKDEAQLDAEQTRLLGEIAAECESAVAAIDAKAKVIINARRQHYQRTGNVLPPSEELNALQAERNATILSYRDKLQTALGEQEWTRFQEYVRRRVAPRITQTQPQP